MYPIAQRLRMQRGKLQMPKSGDQGSGLFNGAFREVSRGCGPSPSRSEGLERYNAPPEDHGRHPEWPLQLSRRIRIQIVSSTLRAGLMYLESIQRPPSNWRLVHSARSGYRGGTSQQSCVANGKRNSKHRWRQPVRTRSETVVPPVCLRCTIGLSACPRLRGRAHHEPRCL
jgi:hypothetical protein